MATPGVACHLCARDVVTYCNSITGGGIKQIPKAHRFLNSSDVDWVNAQIRGSRSSQRLLRVRRQSACSHAKENGLYGLISPSSKFVS